MLSNRTPRWTLALFAVLASAASGFAQTTGSASAPPSAGSGPNRPPPPSAAAPHGPNATGGIIDAGREFDINGQRVLIYDSGTLSLFGGPHAGDDTTSLILLC